MTSAWTAYPIVHDSFKEATFWQKNDVFTKTAKHTSICNIIMIYKYNQNTHLSKKNSYYFDSILNLRHSISNILISSLNLNTIS